MSSDIEKMLEQVAAQFVERGRQEARREIALRLLKNGKLTIEEVVECSGLGVEELKQIQAQG